MCQPDGFQETLALSPTMTAEVVKQRRGVTGSDKSAHATQSRERRTTTQRPQQSLCSVKTASGLERPILCLIPTSSALFLRLRRFAAPHSYALMAASLLTSAMVMAALVTMPAHAQNAIWSTSPAAGNNFNNPSNWTPASVPIGTASFGPTTVTGANPNILSGATNTLNQFQFLAGAPTYSIGVFGTLSLVGGGVTNDSGNQQGIVVLPGGILQFGNNSTAGDATVHYGNRGGAIVFDGSTAGGAIFENQSGGTITFINGNAGNSVIANNFGAATVTFQGTSTAGSAALSNTTLTGGGAIIFADASTAGNAVIQNLTAGDTITFQGNSNAGNATITNVSGSTTTFTDSATAQQAQILNAGMLNFRGASTGGTATITTNSGGTTSFFDSSTGGVARFITNAGGTFDISSRTSGVMTAGSIEGAGNYILGANELTTGLNNLSTTVSGVISGAGGSLIKVGTGVLTLSGVNTYTGPTTVSQGVINLTGSLQSPVTVEPAGTLGSTGTIFNTVTNAGTVEPGFGLAQGQFGALTVNNYVGEGGTLALRTFLGADGSPSDQLVINGGRGTGSTSILVTNVGGPGLETTANGILAVNTINGATTASGAFTLDNPELRAGAYDYRLFRGGLNGTDPTVANDWFLRSSFIVQPGPPGPPFPPEPPPEPLPPGVHPIIGPELATYGVVQPIARQMGLTTLGTLHERVGDAAADAACLHATPDGVAIITNAPPVSDQNCRLAVWGRLFGQQIDNHYQAFADPRASGQVAGIQTGIDVWRGSLIPGHSDTAGLYFAYGNGNVSVDGLVTNAAATAYVLQHTGSLNLNAYSFGGYWTHYGPTGWYIDAVLQGTFYNGNTATQFANLPTNGTGFTSSLEAGYPIPMPWLGPRFVLEPEGQIIWQQVSFQDANDGLGPVGLGTTSGASGRLGLRGKWTISDPAGRVWQPYVLANVWRDWGADATTMFGPDPVPLLEQATRLEFAGGLTAKILPCLSLYAQAGYQFAVSGTDGGRRDGVKGDFGVRYSW